MARSALAFDRGAALAASAVLTVLAVSRIGTARAGEVDWLTPSAKIVEHARREIPPDTWERARCVAVMPAASAGDGAGGRGVMSCRSGERWSAPLFLRLTNGSAAFQAGPGRADLVLLLMNESSVGNILGRRVSLGSGTGVLAYSSSNGGVRRRLRFIRRAAAGRGREHDRVRPRLVAPHHSGCARDFSPDRSSAVPSRARPQCQHERRS